MVIAFKEWLLDLLTELEVLKEVRPILQPRIGMTNVGGFGAWLMDSGPNHTDVISVVHVSGCREATQHVSSATPSAITAPSTRRGAFPPSSPAS